MNLAIWIVAGALLGLMTSVTGRVRTRAGIALYVSAGTLSALAGGLLMAPLMGAAPAHINEFSLPCLIVSLITAVLALGGLRAFRLRRRRWSAPKNSGF